MSQFEQQKRPKEQQPRFGRLLAICVAAVLFCGLLVWLSGMYLQDCCTLGFLDRLIH